MSRMSRTYLPSLSERLFHPVMYQLKVTPEIIVPGSVQIVDVSLSIYVLYGEGTLFPPCL